MSDEKDLNESQENVVDSQTEYEPDFEMNREDDIDDIEEGEYSEEDEELDELDIEDEENSEVIDPNDEKQSPEENAQYKKMRLRAEKEARQKVEKELEAEKQKLSEMRMEIEQKQAEKKIIDEYLNPQKVSDYAYDNDLTESQAKERLEFEARKVIDKQKMEVQEKFNRLQSQKNSLRKDKYFNLLEKEVDEVISKDSRLDFTTVYYHLKGMKSEELEKQLAKNVEKRTIANLHDKSRRKNIRSGDGGNTALVNPSSVLSKEGMEMANAFGHDPREIAQYVTKNSKRKRR